VGVDTVARDMLIVPRPQAGLSTEHLARRSTDPATAQKLDVGASDHDRIELRDLALEQFT
jgi:hypothetical protein